MGYKDKEEAKKAAKDRQKRYRALRKGVTGCDTESEKGVTGVTEKVTPCVTPLGNRVDLIKGEVRTFRGAFGSLNSLLKQVNKFKADLECLKERIALLEDNGINPGSRKNSLWVQKTTTGNGEPVTGEIGSICPKHGRLKIPGAKTNCC